MSEEKKKKQKAKKQTVVERNVAATGIEIDGRFIRVVTMARDGKGRLFLKGSAKKEIFISEELQDEDTRANKLAEGFKALINEYKQQLGLTITSLSRQVVATRNIRLPSQQESEIEDMLFYDVERHVPVPANELELAFDILEQPDDLHTQVLLFAAPRKDMEAHLEIFDSAGVHVDQVVVNVLGLAKAHEKVAENYTTYCLLSLNYQSSNLVVIKNRKPYFSRSISAGFARLKEYIGEESFELNEKLLDFEKEDSRTKEAQEQWLQDLGQDLNRSIHAYQNESFGEPVKKVYLTGALASCPGLTGEISRILNLPVEVADPLEGYDLKSNALEGNSNSHEYSTAIGLALCGVDSVYEKANLLPHTIIEEREQKESKKFFTTAAVLFLTGFLLFAGALGIKINQKRSQLVQLQKYESTLSPRLNELDKVQNQLTMIDELMDKDHSAFKILSHLYEILPERVTIRDLAFKKRNEVSLRLWTFADPEMAMGANRDNLISIMRDSELLKEPKLKAENPIEKYGVNLMQIDLVCEVASASKRFNRR